VVATFIIDWPVLLAIGLLFGGWAPVRPFDSRPFVIGGMVSVVFTATALISYAIAPDWMWMYFIDPSTAVWTIPVITLGYLFFYVLGFAAAVSLRAYSRMALKAAIASALLLEAAVVALTWDRYHLIGSAIEWGTGRAHELFSLSPTGPARTIGLLGPFFLAALGVGIYLVWKDQGATASGR
jgi:hypothetical protein